MTVPMLGTPEQERDLARRAVRRAASELLKALCFAIDGKDDEYDPADAWVQEFARARAHLKKVTQPEPIPIEARELAYEEALKHEDT